MILSRQTVSAIAAFSGLAVLNLSITAWLAGDPRYTFSLLANVQIAQAVLLAFWLVYGRGVLLDRLVVVGFLSVPVYFVPLLRAWKLDSRWLIDAKECQTSPLVAFGLSLLLFGLGRALFRYGIVAADESAIERERQVRFTTRSFFAFTLLIGLLMVTMKLAWQDPDDSAYLYDPNTYPAICGVIMQLPFFTTACLALACVPIPYLLMNARSFAATKTLLYVMFMLLVVFPFGLKIYAEIVYIQIQGSPWYSYRMPWQSQALRVAFSGGGLLAITITGLSLIRSRGFRLLRQSRTEVSTSTSKPSQSLNSIGKIELSSRSPMPSAGK